MASQGVNHFLFVPGFINGPNRLQPAIPSRDKMDAFAHMVMPSQQSGQTGADENRACSLLYPPASMDISTIFGVLSTKRFSH